MNDDDVGNELVSIGAKGTQLTFHQLQDIYNTLTGKTESIRKILEKAYLLEFSDFEQLDFRVSQCCNSYGAEISNCSVSVYHIDGMKEVFSSFQRFTLYNKSYKSPVENVYIEYNFLVIPSGSDQPKKYKLTFNFPSKLGIWEKSPDLAIGPVSFARILSDLSGRVIIEYVDYAAARHFLTQVDEWFSAVDGSREMHWLRRIQSVSHWFRDIFPAFTVVLTLAIFWMLVPEAGGNLIDSEIHVRYLLLVAQFSVVGWIAGKLIARVTEWAIDRIQPMSYVKLNVGDDKLIKRRSSGNMMNTFVTVLGFFGIAALNYAIGIAASITVEKLF